MDDYVSKPIHHQELASVLDRWGKHEDPARETNQVLALTS
jgi:hypothetical protein